MYRAIVTEKLKDLNITFTFSGDNEININSDINDNQKKSISAIFSKYGIKLHTDEKLTLVERIKIAIDNLLESDAVRKHNTSDYLSDKLNYSYTYLSTLFTEATYSSIESYVILRKVEIAKNLLIKTDLTLTEIAFRLNYSSVAHLSRQFKKTTGLTPSVFQKIIVQRKQLTKQG